MKIPEGPFTEGQERRLAALLEHARTLGIRPEDWDEHIGLALADHDEWAVPEGDFEPYEVLMATSPNGFVYASTDGGVLWRRRPGSYAKEPFTGPRVTRLTMAPSSEAATGHRPDAR